MRKLATLSVSFAVAVFAWLFVLPARWVPFLGGFCALLGLGLFVLHRLRSERSRALRLALIATGLSFGLLWSFGYHAYFFASAEALVGRTDAVTLTIIDFPAATASGARMLAQIDLDGRPPVKTLFYTKEEGLAFLPGDRVAATVRCNLATELFGETVTYYTARGIFLTAFASGETEVHTPDKIPLVRMPVYWNRDLRDSIARVFPADAAGVVTAVITGNRDGLTDAFTVALNRTGLAHAVAVSGMHVSFLVGFVMFLVGKNKRRGALFCAPIILLFMVTAGSTPSVVRASVMQLILLAAPLLGREGDSKTSLSFALLLLLLQNPYAAASVGLQLSFTAVLGLILIAPIVQKKLSDRLLRPHKGALPRRVANGVLLFFISLLSASLGAIIFTTPLVAYYFGSVSLIAPLSNLLTLFSVSILFVGGLSAALLGLLWLPMGTLLAFLVAPAARYFSGMVSFLGALPFAAITLDSLYYLIWLLALYAIILAVLLLRGQRRLVAALGAMSLCLCCAVLFTHLGALSRDLTLTALDVGQGQSVALLSKGHAALVDCGGNQRENAGDIAADYLLSLGTSRLDYLVLTHYHTDHANGVPELLARLQVDTIVLPDTTAEDPLRQEILALAQDAGTAVRFLTDTTSLPLGDATLRLYPPMGDGGANEEGLSLLATNRGFDALLTGDMNTSVEAKLVKYGNLPDCEVLIAGHHGSKYATSAALLAATTPEIAILSVGYNHYGHPTDETLLRLADAGADLYRTDLMGHVTITASSVAQN